MHLELFTFCSKFSNNQALYRDPMPLTTIVDLINSLDPTSTTVITQDSPISLPIGLTPTSSNILDIPTPTAANTTIFIQQRSLPIAVCNCWNMCWSDSLTFCHYNNSNSNCCNSQLEAEEESSKKENYT